MEGRTGSTLLMQVLGTAPEIAFDRVYPFENRYLAYLSRLVRLATGQFDPASGWGMMELLRGSELEAGVMPFTPQSLDPAEFRRQLTVHVWQAFSRSAESFAGQPLRYYAEKTVGNSAELLAEAGVAFKMINLVRDPRDILVSIRAFDMKRGMFGFGRTADQSDQEYLAFMVRGMADNLAEMEKAAERFDVLLVRYEDLVTDLSGTARRLSDFIGVDLDVSDPSRLEGHLEPHATSSSPPASIGRWRTEMASADAQQVEAVLSGHLLRLGYMDSVHSLPPRDDVGDDASSR